MFLEQFTDKMNRISSLRCKVEAASSQDPHIDYNTLRNEKIYVTNSSVLTTSDFNRLFPLWENQIPFSGILISARRRHNVYLLDTLNFGPIVLKYTNPGKTKRRSSVLPWLIGIKAHRGLPGSVCEPIAAVDYYEKDHIFKSCLISRYVDGQPLTEPNEEQSSDEHLILIHTAKRIGTYLARLHRCGVHLQDCRMANIMDITNNEHGSNTCNLTIVDIEALGEGHLTLFGAARKLLKLRLPPVYFQAAWAAYINELNEKDLNFVQRRFLWGIYMPLRTFRHHLVRYNRRRLRPLLSVFSFKKGTQQDN
ncbi:hypothetical protein [Halorhodospira halochloris]|nr:hypothetical protein [Halorhodospira halochloris]MCG5547140.1 hypothetical protein [Halorhodospira halochloris]